MAGLESGSALAKRRSKRLASIPVTSANPAERARGTKLKKLGLQSTEADVKSAKKKQLLLAIKEPLSAAAEDALVQAD
jgi:hypothetical protein